MAARVKRNVSIWAGASAKWNKARTAPSGCSKTSAISPADGSSSSPLEGLDLGRVVVLDQLQHWLQQLVQKRMAMARPDDRRLGLASQTRLGLERRPAERHATRAGFDGARQRRMQQPQVHRHSLASRLTVE